MYKWLVPLLAISGVAQSNTINIHRSDIDYFQGQIIVDYRLTLSADPQKVQSLLRDYENFPKISRIISKSQISYDKSKRKVLSQELKPCFLGFCYSITKIQQLHVNLDGSISAVMIPNQRFFKSGIEQWNVSSDKIGATIEYTANITPSFSVPPYIGVWLIRKFIDDEINAVTQNILKLSA